jgi:putative MATE family efflux protein
MTATGSIGLMAIFVVDFLNLFYIALLGQQQLAAAIGYAGTILFFVTSFCIGITIAGTALVSRALGARKREEGRRLATSSLVFMTVASALLSAVTIPLLAPLLRLLGATGSTLDIAWRFLIMVMPATPILGIGMACSGLLRATGDARRSMYVTLAGGLVTALFDPLLIFGFGWGVDGAAIASVISRMALGAVGLYGCIRVHDLLARPSVAASLADARPLAGIAVPAVLANVATPIGNAVVTGAIAKYGDSAVAGYAVIGRIIPLAFGAIFALSGSVGPILGQNLGAKKFDRLKRAITDSLVFMLIYCLAMWLLLVLLQGEIVRFFGASGEGADLIRFFCVYVAGTFLFVGFLFVANAGFNNLGFPAWSTFFNWGRATLGTIPFVWFGATKFGAAGVIAGQAAGSIVFGIAAVIVCYIVVGRMAERLTREGEESIPLISAPLPPFTSGKGATALWSEGESVVADNDPAPQR